MPRNKETFTAAPRQWCMIDIDSLAWEGDLSDQQAMLSYAIQQLPAEFQSADCCYHFSSSIGIKSGINVHLWFWLERTCSDNELKTWLSNCPVDQRMFNPIQIGRAGFAIISITGASYTHRTNTARLPCVPTGLVAEVVIRFTFC